MVLAPCLRTAVKETTSLLTQRAYMAAPGVCRGSCSGCCSIRGAENHGAMAVNRLQ